MLILIIAGSNSDEIKQSTVMYGHQYIHTTNTENASIVMSEYDIDGIVFGPNVSRTEMAEFVIFLRNHPRYRDIPISDATTGTAVQIYSNE